MWKKKMIGNRLSQWLISLAFLFTVVFLFFHAWRKKLCKLAELVGCSFIQTWFYHRSIWAKTSSHRRGKGLILSSTLSIVHDLVLISWPDVSLGWRNRPSLSQISWMSKLWKCFPWCFCDLTESFTLSQPHWKYIQSESFSRKFRYKTFRNKSLETKVSSRESLF